MRCSHWVIFCEEKFFVSAGVGNLFAKCLLTSLVHPTGSLIETKMIWDKSLVFIKAPMTCAFVSNFSSSKNCVLALWQVASTNCIHCSFSVKINVPVFAQVLWTLKFLFSFSHGKLFLVLLQAIMCLALRQTKKMTKILKLFWYRFLSTYTCNYSILCWISSSCLPFTLLASQIDLTQEDPYRQATFLLPRTQGKGLLAGITWASVKTCIQEVSSYS